MSVLLLLHKHKPFGRISLLVLATHIITSPPVIWNTMEPVVILTRRLQNAKAITLCQFIHLLLKVQQTQRTYRQLSGVVSSWSGWRTTSCATIAGDQMGSVVIIIQQLNLLAIALMALVISTVMVLQVLLLPLIIILPCLLISPD